MTRLYTNNYTTTLDGGIDSSQTTFDVASVVDLPSVGGGDTCILTIDDGANREIVSCTGVSTNTLTVVRGQEGTSGTAFATGTTIELRATAASYIDPAGDIILSGTVDAGGATSFEIPNSAAPTVNADGEIAFDTTLTDFSTGVIRFYGNEEQGIVSMPIAEFSSPTDGAAVVYNATNDEFELGSPAGTCVAFSALNDVFQSISASTLTKVAFSTERFDTNSNYDTSTYRFTPTEAGIYLITAAVSLVTLNSAKTMWIYIYKNGSVDVSATQQGQGTASSARVSDLISMNGTTDYLEIYVQHDDSVARNIYNTDNISFFSGSRVALI